MFNTFILIAMAIGVFFLISGSDKKNSIKDEEKLQNNRDKFENEGFKIDKEYTSNIEPKNSIAIDLGKQYFCLYNTNTSIIMPFANLVDVEVYEYSSSETKSNRGSQVLGTAIGGVLLGGAGAVIGGVTGTKTTNDVVEKIELRITIDSYEIPLFDISFLQYPTKRGNKHYNETIEIARNWYAIISKMIRDSRKEESTNIESLNSNKIDNKEEVSLNDKDDNQIVTDENIKKLQNAIKIRRKKIDDTLIEGYIKYLLNSEKDDELVKESQKIREVLDNETTDVNILNKQLQILNDILEKKQEIIKANKKSNIELIGWAILLLVIGSTIYTSLSSPSPIKKSETKVIEKETCVNSPYDGSVRSVEKYLDSHLKDPDSYQSIFWSQVVKDTTTYSVRHKYRAKNGFGGYSIEDKVFYLNKDCSVNFVLDYTK